MLTNENIEALLSNGGDVLSQDGAKIGSIGQVYADDETGQPDWVTVKTGLFGTSESFVPLEGATVQGHDLVVPYSKDLVKDAPRVDADGHLEPEEEDRLYTHYQLAESNHTRTETTGREAGIAATGTGHSGNDDAAGTVGHNTSGPTTDDAMTRSEERLKVGTEKQATGRVRLRKYVTTENVTRTVPVLREEVRVEREPITDANRDEAMTGADISEEEHEIVLHEERPVVQKETVPVERVRLDKDTVTEDVTVDEEVRKEHIDTDGVDETHR
ncbi:uncharacterized protein (TIGR02271 family) [Arthrobacter oryzae]|uniref:YsnF/AvaK domain-containing protein n=1 Tax=Arthrobacter TaxID=1663 RepID=UPI001F1EC04F|nr:MULTISPECIES: YsnF/AvaK domain-containing protein [Arthrobacter]MDP9989368.1 uncharacterized protein (TIGR02271 family) [Arthrobacter oryzae]UKA71462.1 YsnF/AvaK domain-containing protein [Arthrobacter sp. FW306-06-A]